MCIDILIFLIMIYPLLNMSKNLRTILYESQTVLNSRTKYEALNTLLFSSYDDMEEIQEKKNYEEVLNQFDKGEISVTSILNDVNGLGTTGQKLKVIRGLQNSYKEMPGILIIDNRNNVIISNEDGMLSSICKVYFPIIESENQQRRRNGDISNDEFFLLLFSRQLDREKIETINNMNVVGANFYSKEVEIKTENSTYNVIMFKEKNKQNNLITIRSRFLENMIPFFIVGLLELFLLYKFIFNIVVSGFKGVARQLGQDYFIEKGLYVSKLYLSLYRYSKRYVIILNINIAVILMLIVLMYKNRFNEVYPILLASSIVALLYNSMIINVETAIDDIEAGNFNTFKNRRGLGYKRIYNKLKTINEGYDTALNENIKSERMKSELITNVSHDLKTPLTSLINYVNILKTKDLTEEERKEYLDILDKKTQKLKNLIFDLFEVSKLSSGKIELDKHPLDLIELLNQCLGECTPIDNEKNIGVKFESSIDKCIIDVDGEKISRVIENLIGNAYKYTLNDTRIYINVYKEDDNVVMSFKNTSCYEMNFSSQEVFERFVRGDKARTSKIEGSGLGMAIAKSIVELHQGRMKVEIEGDMFKVYVYLPLGEEEVQNKVALIDNQTEVQQLNDDK